MSVSRTEQLFFPRLERQPSYPLEADGAFRSYTFYREHVAVDCRRRCVYCDAHVDEVGGAEAMELDHFRPASLEEFAILKNDPRNLHYACRRCNGWKWNHWPARGTSATHNGRDGFIDPFSLDRLAYFEIAEDGGIRALRAPAGYMISLLRLDREFLRKLRERRQLRNLWRERTKEILSRIDAGEVPDAAEIREVLASVEVLLE